MDAVWNELLASLPTGDQLARVTVRLVAALVLGAVVGIQRERRGKPAGVRTHMLVAMGAALFVVGPIQSGMGSNELSRVIQGLVTGIGFLGGGSILKVHRSHEIEGLTTAAGIWMTAALGAAVGLGHLGLALVSVVLAWFVLTVAARLELWMVDERHRVNAPRPSGDDSP